MEIKVVRQILEWNENCHEEVQQMLDDKHILMVNVMGSPGGGKTTLIKQMITALSKVCRIGIIEGDIEGSIDSEAIARMGIPVVQLNTGGACHIEAMAIKNILPLFDLNQLDLIFVENIGNLVCPAEFNIGEHLKVALLSIPEGDDKVEKYPLMFTEADALILNKYDMMPYFDFDETRVEREARARNQYLHIFKVNSKEGQGIGQVVEWIQNILVEKKEKA